MKISICIPTYNRATHLRNCLNSIIVNKDLDKVDFEICVSDNGSNDDTEKIVLEAQKKIPIKYHKNSTNLGIPRNFINVVNMAEGDFAWLLGDDDLLVPNAISELNKIIHKHQAVDFFFINSYHLTTEYVFSKSQPFDTKDLPEVMPKFSSWSEAGVLRFLDLIDPKISFDFLGGMYLAVFRREKWLKNVNALDKNAIHESKTFSHFDNTFPHLKIFSRAFNDSLAYFSPIPLSVCLTGAREWSPMYPLVRSVRLVEALEEYRKNGLGVVQYLYCKNCALKYFIPDMVSMHVKNKPTGKEHVNLLKLIVKNCLFPNFYFSFIAFLWRKLLQMFSKTTSYIAPQRKS